MDTGQLQDTRIYLAQDMAEPESYSIAGGTACVYSVRCPGKETPNEDAALVIPFDETSGVLAVADGLGGSAAGDRASALAVKALKKAVEQAAHSELPLRSAILNGVEEANQVIQDIGCGAATTLAVVEINDKSIRPYHVGDSMILVVGGRGKLKLQTICHSPVGYGIEAGLLDETEAMHHEDRHIVSNVIGSVKMHIAIGPIIKLAPRDTVVLASDGLSDNLAVQEIAERLSGGRLSVATHNLAHDSTDRMRCPTEGKPSKPDDLTFITFRPTEMNSDK